jgi:hypothetical protein
VRDSPHDIDAYKTLFSSSVIFGIRNSYLRADRSIRPGQTGRHLGGEIRAEIEVQELKGKWRWKREAREGGQQMRSEGRRNWTS